jgi:hypothetical protein
VNGVELSPEEEVELYVLLKPREGTLAKEMEALLGRVEHALFDRFTIEEMEALRRRFAAGR